jgi:hypothetical protein
MEVTRADGSVRAHEIGGGAPVDLYSLGSVGLTLAQGKFVLAELQHHLVQAQTNTVRAANTPTAREVWGARIEKGRQTNGEIPSLDLNQ